MGRKRLQIFGVIGILCFANVQPITAMDFSDGNIAIADLAVQGKASASDFQNKDKQTQIDTFVAVEDEFGDAISNVEIFSSGASSVLTEDVKQEEFVFEYLPSTNTYRVVKGIDKEEVNIPDTYQDKKVSEVGEGAFSGFTKLKKVNIDFNKDVNKSIIIRKNAFEGCSNLQQVSVPYGIAIESHAFNGCDKLSSLGVVAAETIIAEDAFDKDTKVIVFTDSGMPELDKRGIYNFPVEASGYEKAAGVSYLLGTVTDFDDSTDEIFILEMDKAQTKTSIIGRKSFYGCDNVTAVQLPDTVKTIETKAFYGCTNLKKITIPDSVASISEDAFENTPGVSIYASSGSYAAKFAQAHGIPLNGDFQVPDTGNIKAVVNKNMVTINVSGLVGDAYNCILGTDVQEGKPICGDGKRALAQTGKKVTFRNVPKGVYYLGIRPYKIIDGSKKYGKWSEIKTIKISVITPARPKIKSAKVSGKDLTVNVSLPKGAAGYNLVLGKASVKNDSSVSSIVCPAKIAYRKNSQKKTSVQLKKLKRGNYSIGIQTYNYQNGMKVYSQWSPLKNVKVL